MEAPLPTTLLVSSFPPSSLWHRQQGQEQKAPHAHHQKRSLSLSDAGLDVSRECGKKEGRKGGRDMAARRAQRRAEREGIFLCHFSPAFVPPSLQATLVIAHWDNAAVPAACGRAGGRGKKVSEAGHRQKEHQLANEESEEKKEA